MHLTVCIWFCAQRAELDKVGMTLNRTFPNFLYRVRNWIRFLLFSPLVICRNPSLPITDLQHFWNFSGIKYTCRNKQRFHLHSCAQSSKSSSLPAADFCSLLWRRSLSGCRYVWGFGWSARPLGCFIGDPGSWRLVEEGPQRPGRARSDVGCTTHQAWHVKTAMVWFHFLTTTSTESWKVTGIIHLFSKHSKLS